MFTQTAKNEFQKKPIHYSYFINKKQNLKQHHIKTFNKENLYNKIQSKNDEDLFVNALRHVLMQFKNSIKNGRFGNYFKDKLDSMNRKNEKFIKSKQTKEDSNF